MSKNKLQYICQECGYTAENWMGRCTNCGAWNSFQEQNEEKSLDLDNQEEITPSSITEVKSKDRTRFTSGIGELDRVLGGGMVKGSLILLGGAPGIGKSTLILQVAFLFSKDFSEVLYISGEESARQIKLRAERIGALDNNLFVLPETDFSRFQGLISKGDKYKLVIIDSIQTIYDSRVDSAPGSIKQVKGVANQLLKMAKRNEITIILIGHVTKQGYLAGPKVLEHLVDAVLQFEGNDDYSYRILRSVKNRFGSTNEIGVFEMQDKGMKEVKNPSRLFIRERAEDVSGSIIVPVLEGSRTILVEVQALVSSSAYATPQRLATGFGKKRLSILLAVLEKQAGFEFEKRDVHINITGGIKVDEPALDLGILTAIISSCRDYPLPSDMAVVGEIGLAGEIRAVNQIEKRIQELIKVGFKEIIIPEASINQLDFKPEINLKGVKNIHEFIDLIFL